MKNLLLLLCLFIVTTITAQKPTKVSNLLFNNQRVEALKIAEKMNTDKVEDFMLQLMTKQDNGLLEVRYDAVEELLSKKDFEPYLFAFWKEPYIFNDYSNVGFSETKLDRIKSINTPDFDSPTVSAAFAYLKSFHLELNKDFEGQEQLIKSIPRVKNWEFVGPFENLNESGLNIDYKPETTAVSQKGFDTNGNGIINWYKNKSDKFSPYENFGNHDEYGNKINYAQTFIVSDKQQRVVFNIGRGGLIKVFINDQLILENKEDVQTAIDAHQIAVNLNEGVNRVLFKLASSKTPYFSFRVFDLAGNSLNLDGQLENKKYQVSTEDQVQPEILTHPFEKFFQDRLTKDPNNVVNSYGLINTLQRNGRYEKAIEIAEQLCDKYPKSSLLKVKLMTLYFQNDQNDEGSKLYENLLVDDPDYYQSLILEFSDTDKLFKLDAVKFKEKMTKIKNATNYSVMRDLTDLFIALRNEETTKAESILDKMMDDPDNTIKNKLTYGNFYRTVFNNDEKYRSFLEETNEKYYSLRSIRSLASLLKRENKKEEWEELLINTYKRYEDQNSFISSMVYVYNENKKYDESIKVLKQGLENYPDALRLRTLMGDTYLKLENKKEAIKWYEDKLSRSLSDLSLRRKVYNLKEITDPIEKIKTPDHYDYIKKNRKSGMENNYGFNILLDENNVMLYKRGGVRYHGTVMYEVTSLNGIESLKEYDLGLGGDYVISKSEIVKPDGSLEPAERSGSSMVFNNLEVNDVIYIDYETEYYSYGRFYKDYDNVFLVKGYHPKKEYYLRIINEGDNELFYEVMNGELPVKNYKTDGMKTYEWKAKNIAGIELAESYMKQLVDQTTHIHLSTLSNWKDISQWYSDLVRSQIEIDETVKSAYKTIFPNGHDNMSDDEKAKAIYTYVTDEFTYSYVSFKQSGYVPQKPSKTIKSKLGDCKDFSTVFVALASMVDLDANLVLILTSDYGVNALRLPSRDFNHCIVKVNIDGKEQFLELTDKYLPYRSIPSSLNYATGLEIPYDANDELRQDLFTLKNVDSQIPSSETYAVVKVINDEMTVNLKKEVKNSTSSYLRSLLDEQNEKLKKENIKSYIENRSSTTFDLESLNTASYTHKSDGAIVEVDLKLTTKPGSIGSMKTFQLPLFSVPYTKDIIEKETRKYDILYRDYEDCNLYTEKMVIELEEGKKFVEIPENKKLTYKDHQYEISYKEIAVNKMEINIVSSPGLDIIPASEYKEFREFVNQIMETRTQYLAYK